MDTGIIEHEGIVQCAEKGVVHVKITSRSACGACKARQACGMAETQEKIVVVPTPEAGCYTPGEAVFVGVRKKAGRIAVLLAYGGALVVFLAALILSLGGFGAGAASASRVRSPPGASISAGCGSAGAESNTQFNLQ